MEGDDLTVQNSIHRFIMKQPDLGTSIVFIAITAAIILVAGISWKIILPVFISGAAAVTTLLWAAIYAQLFMSETLGFDLYQFKRIYYWLDPYSFPSSEGMHLIQAITAIGFGRHVRERFSRPGKLTCQKIIRTSFLQSSAKNMGLSVLVSSSVYFLF